MFWLLIMFNSLFKEEKEALSKQKESDSEEDQPKQKVVCSPPPPTSQRVPIFPGMNPSALIVSALRVLVSIIYYVKEMGGIQKK